jgi:hypothetical protein
MTRVILDTTVQQILHNLTQPLELCNEAGKLLARVVPVLDQTQFEPVVPQLSADELQRRRQEPDYSTAEVLAFLENL